MSEEDEGPAAKLEEWTFLGQDASGTYRWRDEGGEDLSYGKLAAKLPGGLYEVEIKRGEGRITAFPGTLRYLGPSPVQDRGAIQVQAQAWERERLQRALEKRTARYEAIDATLGDLLALAAKVKGYHNRQVLADYVTAKIHTATQKKET